MIRKLNEDSRESVYEGYWSDFRKKVEHSADAYKDCVEKKINFSENNIYYRGEELQKFVAASWHYAYLKSIQKILDMDIFNGYGNYSGIEKIMEECAYYGDIWLRDKNNLEKKKQAADKFLTLIINLRVFHFKYSASITGSWGTCFTVKTNEYFKMNELVICSDSGFFKDNKFNDFRDQIMNDTKAAGLYYRMILSNSAVKKYSQYLSKNPSAELKNYGSYFKEKDDIVRRIKDTYGREDFSLGDAQKLWDEFINLQNSYSKSTLGAFGGEAPDTQNTVTSPLAIRYYTQDSALPDFAKRIFLPEARNRNMYNLFDRQDFKPSKM
jgi:hypothetical protein